jgi:hypothetical protein
MAYPLCRWPCDEQVAIIPAQGLAISVANATD